MLPLGLRWTCFRLVGMLIKIKPKIIANFKISKLRPTRLRRRRFLLKSIYILSIIMKMQLKKSIIIAFIFTLFVIKIYAVNAKGKVSGGFFTSCQIKQTKVYGYKENVIAMNIDTNQVLSELRPLVND